MVPFFMAYLRKRPTYFVKGDVRRAAYYTIQAAELRADGYVEEGEPAVAANISKPLPEVAVEAGGDGFDLEGKVEESSEDLDEMTKAELLAFAEEYEIDVNPSMLKSEILQKCKEYENND